jgi:hypothetical protein
MPGWWWIPFWMACGCSSGRGDPAPCLTDTDCPGGLRCVANRCIVVEPCAGVKWTLWGQIPRQAALPQK